jgi:hypothetical protein
MSGGQFKVGDVCVGQNFEFNIERNGQECEVLRPMGRHAAVVQGHRVSGFWWRVRWSDGAETDVRPFNLRRKQPPKPAREIDTVVSWSDCAWSPERVPA